MPDALKLAGARSPIRTLSADRLLGTVAGTEVQPADHTRAVLDRLGHSAELLGALVGHADPEVPAPRTYEEEVRAGRNRLAQERFLGERTVGQQGIERLGTLAKRLALRD